MLTITKVKTRIITVNNDPWGNLYPSVKRSKKEPSSVSKLKNF
jgi:hypothetical protein